ncbi:dipeptidyl peptidase 2-like [Halichondria panicea]|uniref:dipeptidyl peptidase 2-like n=1 Tax=Halichondria panicea TaxID=6063 RepID=UPI00312BCAF0
MIADLAKQGDTGLQKITDAFSLCTPLKSDRVAHLEGWVRNSFTQLAMVDYPYPANFLAPLPANPVSYSCNLLLTATDRLKGLAQAAGLFYNGTAGRLPCNNIETQFIECADPTGCGTGPAATSWDYQACTEMSLPSDTNNMTDMFPPTIFDPSAYCEKTWGAKHRKGWMDTQFWGKNILAASNIIFSNGNLDPWSVGGVQQNLSDSLVAIMIEGGAHHLDLRSANPKDPPAVIAARKLERDTIAKWIK